MSQDLKQLLVVLMMTLPGSPAFQDEENNQTHVKPGLGVHISKADTCIVTL